MDRGRCISADPLRDFATAVYISVGMPAADARLAADSLVQADLWGHQSHGVMRLSWYAARLKAGVCDPVAKPRFVTDVGAVAVIDGHDAMGQVLMDLAVKEALRRAKAHGIGAIGLRNSNHFGTSLSWPRLKAALPSCPPMPAPRWHLGAGG
jgi:LDH2 family malate/lactate/ureidoglycolate dehydrogenase